MSTDETTTATPPTATSAAADDRAALLAARYEDPDPVPTWDEVATEYGPRVYAMAYHLTGDRHAAEDLAQDVFVRVYRNLDKYTPGTFDGWLYRITKNLFLDGIRRRRRVRTPTRSSTGKGSTARSSAPSPSCPRRSGPPSCSATSRA